MTIRIEFTEKYIKQSVALPRNEQKKLAKLLPVLSKDPFSPELHTKRLTGHLSGYYSFRINREFRVMFSFRSRGELVLLRVKHRKDIYR